MRATLTTISGRQVDLVNPAESRFGVYDIAHALSRLCRFNGHVHGFYSVAQHSVFVSHLVPPEHARAALFHDAAEAFLGDVTTPLKRLLPDYEQLERQFQIVIARRFSLPFVLPEEVHQADQVALATERRDLLQHCLTPWPALEGVEPHTETIEPLPPGKACDAFIERYLDVWAA